MLISLKRLVERLRPRPELLPPMLMPMG